MSKEALQNPESLQKNPKFLKILLRTHCQHKPPASCLMVPGDTVSTHRRWVTPSEEGTRSCSTLPVEVRSQTNQHIEYWHVSSGSGSAHILPGLSLQQLDGYKPKAHACQTHQRTCCLTGAVTAYQIQTPGGIQPRAARTRPDPPHRLHGKGFSRGSRSGSVSALWGLWGQTDGRSGFSQMWVVALISGHCNDQQFV